MNRMTLNLFFLTEWWIIVLVVVVLLMLIAVYKSRYNNAAKLVPHKNVVFGEYSRKIFAARNGLLKYNILFPRGFKMDKKYPLLIFLHGVGERGSDNRSQLKHGGAIIQKELNRMGGIAILPQCPLDDYWIDSIEVENGIDGKREFEPDNESFSKSLSKVKELIEFMMKKEYLDADSVYVAGLSMGGMGTLDLCWRMPNAFAAATVICGAGSVGKAYLFSDLPIRFYHGEDDRIVLARKTEEMAAALQAAGGDPEVYLYPEVGHNSWENAFAESDFISWFFKHKQQQ